MPRTSRAEFADGDSVVWWLHWMERCGMHGTGWSNLRKSQSVEIALRAAIIGGAKFPPNTFTDQHCALWHAEWMYAVACEANNKSACTAIERALNRPRFIWDGRIVHEGFSFWHPELRSHWRINSFGYCRHTHGYQWYANASNVTPARERVRPARFFEVDRPPPEPECGRKRMRFFYRDFAERERLRRNSRKQSA